MHTHQLIAQVEEISKKNHHLIENKINQLSSRQLLWKPSTEHWNILEIIAHCNAYLGYYNPLIDKSIQTTKFLQPKSQFISSPLGSAAWKSIKLGNENNLKRKFQSNKKFNPLFNKELIEGDIINDFTSKQIVFRELLLQANKVNMQRVKIPVSFASFIRLRLGDIFLFLAYHEERHMHQINQLISHRGFPKN